MVSNEYAKNVAALKSSSLRPPMLLHSRTNSVKHIHYCPDRGNDVLSTVMFYKLWLIINSVLAGRKWTLFKVTMARLPGSANGQMKY